MRKTFLAAVFIFLSAYAAALEIESGEKKVFLSFDNIVTSFPDFGFSYQQKHVSYSRIDEDTFLDNVENPYQEERNYGFFSSSAAIGGRMGALFSFGMVEAALSLNRMQVFGISFLSSHFDAALLYRNEKKDDKSIITDYRAKGLDDVVSLGIRGKFLPYFDADLIISFSPVLGLDLFFRSDISFGFLEAGFYWGNTFSRRPDNDFALRLEIEKEPFYCSFFILYGKKPYFSQKFRAYESNQEVRIDFGWISFLHESRIDFAPDAEKRVSHLFSIAIENIEVGLGSGMIPYVDVSMDDFSLGCGADGVFVEYVFNNRVTVRLDENGLDFTFSFEFA